MVWRRSWGGQQVQRFVSGVGLPSGGTITVACAIVGGALLAWGGGKAGSEIGDGSATILYEATHER